VIAARGISTLQEKLAVLNCRRLPARLNVTEVAVLLGFKEHDIAGLVAGKLLRPLGRPAQNAPKHFAASDIVERASDREWLARATRVISELWQKKNERKQCKATSVEREVEK
jgi:hypothetical protein